MRDLDARELELAAKEAELHREESAAIRANEDRARLVEVEQKAALLDAREREVVKREAELSASEQLAASNHEHVEKRRSRVDKIETSMNARLKEIEERESAVMLREAQIEADVDIRLDKLEKKEQELADLEARLERRERDLAVYVGNLQAQGRELTPDDKGWWAKQLGADKQPA
jgi:uncharacterized protein (DUF3084 family)